MAYEVSDHLGNVRAIATRKNTVYIATMENYSTESQLFSNYVRTQELFDGINHTPTDNIVTYVSKLYGAPNLRVGPTKVLQVNPGERVDMEVYVKYLLAENVVSTGAAVGNIFEQVVSAFGGADGGNGAEQSIYDMFQLNFGGALAVEAANGDFDNEPRAYLNYLFFDENGVYKYGGYAGMTDAAKIPYENGIPVPNQIPHEKLALDLEIYEPGYVYIYVANESSEAATVFFDDLMITHSQTVVSQTTDYYPFGSILRRAQTNQDKQYSFGYQGQYAEEDKETGWSHFEAREYDPIIGRWMVPDPAREFYSPYLAMGNSPINLVDPDGRCIKCPKGGNQGDEFRDVDGQNYMVGTDGGWIPIYGDKYSVFDAEIHEGTFSGTLEQYQLQYPEFAGMSASATEQAWKDSHSKGFYNAWADKARRERSIEVLAKLQWFATAYTHVGGFAMGAYAINSTASLPSANQFSISIRGINPRPNLNVNSNQLGTKFGEHMDASLPGYRTHLEYRSLVHNIYRSPNSTYIRINPNARVHAGEHHFYYQGNLLRLSSNGSFRSLYPIN